MRNASHIQRGGRKRRGKLSAKFAEKYLRARITARKAEKETEMKEEERETERRGASERGSERDGGEKKSWKKKERKVSALDEDKKNPFFNSGTCHALVRQNTVKKRYIHVFLTSNAVSLVRECNHI